MTDPTTRAYTLKLSGDGDWRDLLWTTHVAVNRGAQVWGDWLLTLRGGLPASLADDDSILPVTDAVLDKELKRRKLKQAEREALREELQLGRRQNLKVLLALSWLSVESPASLAPQAHIVARGDEKREDRSRKVRDRFQIIMGRLKIQDQESWLAACEPSLTARIRDDAVWVDRALAFSELRGKYLGLTGDWAANTLFRFLGGAEDYFAMPDAEATPLAESKDFVKKAGGWLSRNWGAGEKSDSAAIGARLAQLAAADAGAVVGKTGGDALLALLNVVEQFPPADGDPATAFKQIKQTVGWKGRPSKGAIALEKVRDAEIVTTDLWQHVSAKFDEEAADQSAKDDNSPGRPDWKNAWRTDIELRLGMPYRAGRDLIWEHGVALDHALRRVSAAHTWIKRAEASRRQFQEDAAKIESVPQDVQRWLDQFCEDRSESSGAAVDYFIRKRAIDGWERIVQAWAALPADADRRQRIDAAREVQRNLDDHEKLGDIQLFAGFGDEDDDEPQSCLADDQATCVWRGPDGKPDPHLLKNYVAAKTAEHDQRRFKVPAYRHPDPLRNPIYVDYGNSRWGIAYSALKAAQQRAKACENLAKSKTERAREKLRQQLNEAPDLRGVALAVWTGASIQSLPLRWFGRRLWNDLDLDHFGNTRPVESVSRADRLGRVVARQSADAAVNVVEVFRQKDWNGRLQVPRAQLDRLADLVYGKRDGKRLEPDYARLDQLREDSRAGKLWRRLNWFLTTSAKLLPHGPWLDYERAGLPQGIAYKKGRSGYYLDYAANQGRKSRARLQLARLPGLRILSLDLGHRYAAACAVWETITRQAMLEACREAGHPEPQPDDLYAHLGRQTGKLQKSGRKKGQPVTETTIYRRVGPDVLPDGSPHPAPWARLERQFVIRLQGEDRAARRAKEVEIQRVNEFRAFLGLPLLSEVPRIDDLQRGTIQIARLGLRRLGDAARIAYAMTAAQKPISGGRFADLSPEERIEYLLDALIHWQRLAGSQRWQDEFAQEKWQAWVVTRLAGPQALQLQEDLPGSEEKKRLNETRGKLRPVAGALADPESASAVELHRLWSDEWKRRDDQWRMHLRRLRRLVLPRAKDALGNLKAVRNVGGLSLMRLKTIRDLYQTLKAFRMRPEPASLTKNVPAPGDESLAKFGRRILDQLERLREQRIKQLASRVIEAALGAGRTPRQRGRDHKRNQQGNDRPCHAVVVENLEHYRPEDSRLRREKRQLMDWAARNVRKYIVEGCELHGLRFEEVPPAYTSKQDSRTGAPGIRCEDVSRGLLQEAARRAATGQALQASQQTAETKHQRELRQWTREFAQVDARIEKRKKEGKTPDPRDAVIAAVREWLAELPPNCATIRLPRRGGEVFVSAATASPAASGLQADLNAAANVGLKALTDPDWFGAWWFVLVTAATGLPVVEKVQGCPEWDSGQTVWQPRAPAENGSDAKPKKSRRGSKPAKTDVYAFSLRHWRPAALAQGNWLATKDYWTLVENEIAQRLSRTQSQPENPF